MDQLGAGRLPEAPVPPAGVRRIASEEQARTLAHRLVLPGRRWPVVVLTIAGGQDEPFGDPAEIKEAVGDLAEVVLMPTSDISWAFSAAMPSMTQVYGGAGRVYPVDHGWVNTPARSRLRFAYSPRDRRRITDLLINDALEAALAAGLLTVRMNPGVRQRSGRVQGVIGSRALVTLDDGAPATVWEELTLPGVALDRVVVKGQSVTGAYDPVSRRLDLRGELCYTDAASAEPVVAAAYRVGDVVLADVIGLTDDIVSVRLLPGLTVEVGIDAVTSNPDDTLRDLFTLGEVVVCRVVAADPLRLRLDDVDDDEVPKAAPSLLPGGPPWLRLPEPDRRPAVQVAVPAPAEVPSQPVARTEPPRRPSPLDMVRRNPAPGQRPVPLRRFDVGSLEQERTRVAELSNELAAERATRKGLANELASIRARAAELESELDRALRSIEQLQTRYRSADLARQRALNRLKVIQNRAEQPAQNSGPAFLDPEEQFQYEVYREWVQRIPAADKAGKPLADYVLGPEFLGSIQQLEGVSRSKVVAVVVEVLTEQVQHLSGRGIHRLRTGGAGSPYVSRDDGATCWRVALQRETAAARRLHYWRTPGGGYELSRVVLHDDYRP